MKSVYFQAIIVQALLLMAPLCLFAQSSSQDPAKIQVADTSSPRDTLRSFINACNDIHELIEREKYFDRDAPEHAYLGMRILDCLDVSDLPVFARNQRAGEVGSCIKEILDREELPPWEKIPDLDMIEAAGGFEKLTQWRIPGTRITITRIEEGPQRHEYLFSKGTVSRAVEYYNQVKSKPYRKSGPPISDGLYQWFITAPGDPTLGAIVQKLPLWMQKGRSYGLANWKWLGLLITLPFTLLLMMATYRVYGLVVRKMKKRSALENCLTLIFPIIGALIPLAFLHICENYLTIRGTPYYLVSFLSILTALFASLFVLFAACNRIAETIISSPRINPMGLNAQLIRIASRLFSVAASLCIILYGGQYLGIRVATLLASAGIGGIALALGAQDTLKTLFGTIALMADKPFRVGDRIIFEAYDGIVEDIGLRSTRLRLLTGNLVAIPNNQLSGKDLENVTARSFIRHKGEIFIPLDTPCEKVEQAVQILRDKLGNHQGMDSNYPPKVYFDEIGPNAFTILYVYWYAPPDYWAFKEFNATLNFEIFHAFEEHGIQFSLPQRHSYWKDDQHQAPLDINIVSNDASSEAEK